MVTTRNTINKTELDAFLSNLRLRSCHHSDKHANCSSSDELIKLSSNTGELSQVQFMHLLPAIVSELINACDHHNEVSKDKKSAVGWQAIVSTAAAVLVIGASGIVVVVILPYISERFYHVVVQFLIALSVGSLIGDAFLHLIPHALFGTHDHELEDHGHEDHDASHAKHDHMTIIAKSIMAVLGVYLFFVTERLTILHQNRIARQKAKRDLVLTLAESTVPKDTDFTSADGSNSNGVVSKNRKVDACNSSLWMQPSSRPTSVSIQQKGCNNDGADPLGAASDFKPPCVANQFCNCPPERPPDNAHCEDHLKGYLGTTTEYCLLKVGNTDSRDQADVVHPMYDGDPYNRSTDKAGTVDTTVTLRSPQENLSSIKEEAHHSHAGNLVTVESHLSESALQNILHEKRPENRLTHLHRDRPHGHHHGHSHDLSSVSAIAYTIIVGDGLHNFFDGVAIGAAFASNLRGGLSTAIAVLCHELPHEVGDFVVLLKAGISVKMAVFCNILSSILCGIGAAIGLSVGHMESVDSWLFMLTAGMFVYIALMDMMPELATDYLQGHRLCHRPGVLFMWQNLGIILGCVIMLAIALYEGRVI